MSSAVIDTSVVLAVFNQEISPEATDAILNILLDGAINTVNLAEAHGKLVSRGIASQKAWNAVNNAVGQIIDFNHEQARIAGELVPMTSPFGLSLGDRACLALGLALGVPVYTADRAWAKLKLGVPIHLIR